MKTVSGKTFCKFLEQHGWELQRVCGSHHIYTKSDREEILTVPVHGNKDLKKGTLQKLLKDSGLNL
ncbi:type II toxin-antitoxin system HicA family toxin [Candidatus Thiosymbion oneisti]|uniref:type II toxin-antitoxin system HicA family toxin n=1 Tax=Candidatus Thiosymbion oneisti TaxID=589554 RepID=UPI00105D60DE|nr:type II toxin-antitoxin system HicA family toxin [Candidatus Thiosymbion oneisti]